LGFSRKTYYEWEDRALAAMAEALANRRPGRPPVPLDVEKEELQRGIRDLEKKLYLAEKMIEVKELLSAYETFRAGGVKRRLRSRSGSWRLVCGRSWSLASLALMIRLSCMRRLRPMI
jgi:hypothetical protein